MPNLPFNSYDVQATREAVSVAGSSTEEVVLTWPATFPDTDYTVIAQVESGAGSLGSSLRIFRITERATSSATISIRNDNISELSGTVHAVAVHDGAFK